MTEASPHIDPDFEKEIEEERLEAEEFLRGHGVLPFGERLATLVEVLNPKERQRLEELSEEFCVLDDALKQQPEVERMKFMEHLAGKANPKDLEFEAGEAQTIVRPFHTRYEHSELFALLARVAGIKAHLSDEEIKTLIAGAWLHDTGHAAFSHIGEQFLEKAGYPSHEQRSVGLILGRLASALEEQGLSPEKVAEVVQEKDPLGQLQSTLDTLAYMIFDTAMIREPKYDDHGKELLTSIEGVDASTGHVRVSSLEPWQTLLEDRAQYMQDFVYHPTNKMLEEAKRQLIRIAIQEGHIRTEELVEGHDSELNMRLQSLVQRDPGAAVWGGRKESTPHLKKYADLYQCSTGVLPEGWESRSYPHESEAYESLYEALKEGRLVDMVKQRVVVGPFDYTKKKLTVQCGGEDHTLQAQTVDLREEDKNYIVYAPRMV